jgi:iron complex outermembrane receptor protein
MNQQNKNALTFAQRSLLALAVAGAFPMHAALAQEAKSAAAAKAESTELETVIVTAQRRSENVKDVPLSISTLKGDNLEALTASGQDIRLLSARTPSLNVESDFGRSFPRFYIRGLGNTDFDLNASQPVGLVFDDVVQENPILKGFPLFDIEQVEVLRGPQGTLFGRNSPAGVIKFESAKPSDKLEGYASLGVGNDGVINAETAINLPISKEWAARISLQSQHRDDRVSNPLPGPTKDFEGYDDQAARLQLSFKPNKNFSALLGLQHRDYEGSASLFRANIIQKGTNELVPGFNYDLYPTDGGNSQTLRTDGYNLRLKWDLESVTLNSITAYETAKFYSRGDVDGGFGAGPGSGPGFIPFAAETADGLPVHHQFSQEFRIASNTKDPLQWLAGVYYFDEKIVIDSFNFESLNNNNQFGYAQQTQTSKAYAAFGSINYEVNDKLKLRGGLRYTNDKKDFSAERTVSPFGNPTVGPLTANPRSTNFSWDLSGTYALDQDTNLFAHIATGYRAPSVQGRVLFADTISVADSEKALSYEVGVKKELFNRRARFSASVFQYRVSDLQLTAGSGSVNQNRLVNADKAIGQGVEFDFQAKINPNWKTTFGGSYNDTEIRDKNLFVAPCGGGCTVTDAAGTVAGTVLIDGNPLPRAPKWVANWTLGYSTPIGNGDFYASTDWSYRGTYNFFLYEAKEYKGKSLLEGGVRVGYKWGDGKYEVAAYGRNITNEVQLVGAIDFNNLTGILNEPRSYGAQFRINW